MKEKAIFAGWKKTAGEGDAKYNFTAQWKDDKNENGIPDEDEADTTPDEDEKTEPDDGGKTTPDEGNNSEINGNNGENGSKISDTTAGRTAATAPSTVKTGDEFNIGLWLTLMLLAAAGLMIAIYFKKKKLEK